VIVSFSQMSNLVAHAVADALAEEAEETCGGAATIAEWAAAHDGPDVEALAGLIGGLACDMLAALTLSSERKAA
jgi:hypothetical protein